MNIRHAAALALVGWYLLMPPWGTTDWNTSAPLTEWNVGGATHVRYPRRVSTNEIRYVSLVWWDCGREDWFWAYRRKWGSIA